MPITTADWLRYIESLGPADPQSLQLRLQAAGVDPQRAEWIATLHRRRDFVRRVASIATVVLTAGLVWCAYQWWLALSGAANAPGMVDVAKSAGVVFVGAVALLIASAIEISSPLDLLAHPQIPSALPPPPRHVTFATSPAVFGRFGLAIAALMCGFFTLLVPEVRNHVWLEKHGEETTGEITSVYTTRGSKGRIRYHVAYRFDGGEGSESVGRERYEELKPGQRVPVTYLPNRPQISTPRSKADVQASDAVFGDRRALAMAYPVLFVPLILVVVIAKLRRPRGVAVIGVPTVGTVGRVLHQAVDYTFRTAEGAEQKGRYVHGKRRLRERPAVGQPLVILYDPARPKRSVPLGALGDMTFGS